MKLRRIIAPICAVGLAVTALAGCGVYTTKSGTFNVTNGDKVKITLNTSNGYDMNLEMPFTVTKDGKDTAVGLLTTDGYQELVDRITGLDGVDVFNQGEKNGNKFTCYSYAAPQDENTNDPEVEEDEELADGEDLADDSTDEAGDASTGSKEYDCLVAVKDTSTTFRFATTVSEDEAKGLLDRFTIEKAE